MVYNLNGKVVLVTGAASGIGAAVVKRLLDENVKHVVMMDINEEEGVALRDQLNTKCKEIKVSFIKCDVTDKEGLLEAYKTITNGNGYVDVVFNSAGILDDSSASYIAEININFSGVVTSTLNAWNTMHVGKGGSGGTIINFSSVAAICNIVNFPIYCATKSAVLRFSTDLGSEAYCSKSGVRVLTMCFGLTNTPIIRKINNQIDDISRELFERDILRFKLQSPESAASGVIEAYKQGASGSVWISTSDKPAMDITGKYKETFELFNDDVFN